MKLENYIIEGEFAGKTGHSGIGGNYAYELMNYVGGTLDIYNDKSANDDFIATKVLRFPEFKGKIVKNANFKSWQANRGYETFFEDGALCKDTWDKTPLKVLFLLKESYLSSKWYGIDGPIDINNGKNKKFWPNIVRWKYLLHETARTGIVPEFPNWEQLPEVMNKNSHIDDIAYVNVKKPLGTSISLHSEIMAYAERDREFLTEQIDALAPDVVLCGGTFWPYHFMYNGNDTITKIDERVYQHGDRLILDFYNPGYYAAKGGEKGLYQKLAEIVRDPDTQKILRNLSNKKQSHHT